MNRWHALVQSATKQRGLVTAGDLRRHQIPASTFARRARDEGWARAHRGVWILPGQPPDPVRDIHAAVLAVGHPVWVARRSAAFLWGLGKPASTTELVVPLSRSRSAHPGIRTLRTAALESLDQAEQHGLPVTSPARTLADCAAVTPHGELLNQVIAARQRRLVEVDALAIQAARLGPVRGARRFRRVVELFAEQQVDSLLELEIREDLARRGFPRPHPEPYAVRVPDGTVIHLDIAWPHLRVAIEVDGFLYHQTYEDLNRDHLRSNQAAAAGWIVVRVGWHRWRRDTDGFLAELRAVLAQRSAALR